MSLALDLLEAQWDGDAPQLAGIRSVTPILLRAWRLTLGTADVLRSIAGGEPFAAWLEQIIDSGGGEHLLTLDPIAVGDLQATWGWQLRPALAALRTAATDHDFMTIYAVVRSADEVEAVLLAWADCIEHALVGERGLIGLRT